MKINSDVLIDAKVNGSMYAKDFQCKNLLDESQITSVAKNVGISYDGTKVYSTNTTSDNRGWNYANANYYITLKAGTYTLTLKFLRRITNSSGGLFRFFKEDNSFIANTNAYNVDSASNTFTLTATTKLGLYFKLYDGQVNIQIEPGDISTDYVPFTYINENVDDVIDNLQTSVSFLTNKNFATKMDFNLGDNGTTTFTMANNGVYLYMNTHIYKGDMVLIMYHPTVGLRTVTICGTPNATFTNNGNVLTVTVSSQCRGSLFRLNATS